MQSTQSPSALSAPGTVRPVAPQRALLAAFTAAIFLSAFLLFLVQPLYSKMVLPLLGGTPAVWNTCMLFFQAALLGGYLYAHATSRWLTPARQALLHGGVLALAVVSLPISVAGAAPGGAEPPIPWLLMLMATTVGLPFFALAGTGPILQRWFSHSGHPEAGSPYFLYAASNLGSLIALLGYPLAMEPTLRLAEQSRAWAAGYAGLGLLVVACAVGLRRAPGAVHHLAGEADAPVTTRDRAGWVLLALVPSGLLLSVTTFITTDLAPIPLLWVVPLALYLATFVLAFARRPVFPGRGLLALQLLLVLGVVAEMAFNVLRLLPRTVPLHLAAFTVTAMVCHGELSRRRPAARHLTEFYLWLSFGGMLGGVFNVMLAPRLFPRMEEYALLLVVACLVRPRAGRAPRQGRLALAVAAAGVVFFVWKLDWLPVPAGWRLSAMAALVVATGIALAWSRVRLALFLAAVLGVGAAMRYQDPDLLHIERSFFGRHSVQRVTVAHEGHLLYHGATAHGAQWMSPETRRQGLTYYSAGGPLGQAFAGLPRRPARRVAVVGLGAGSSAVFARAGEAWTFYEIDPGVAATAADPRFFTFLKDSPARNRVVLGDARLSLVDAPPGGFDLIILDAFNSASIPMHLMTREAFDLYLSRLAPGGAIIFHVSNRYLDLEPAVAALARDRGLAARMGAVTPAPPLLVTPSHWAVMARAEGELGTLAGDPRWKPLRTRAGVPVWTDDFSNLLGVLGAGE